MHHQRDDLRGSGELLLRHRSAIPTAARPAVFDVIEGFTNTRLPDEEGFHGVETDDSSRRDVLEERWFDRKRRPTPGPEGCVRKLQPRGGRGAVIEEQCIEA